jgi:hypothetical protein
MFKARSIYHIDFDAVDCAMVVVLVGIVCLVLSPVWRRAWMECAVAVWAAVWGAVFFATELWFNVNFVPAIILNAISSSSWQTCDHVSLFAQLFNAAVFYSVAIWLCRRIAWRLKWNAPIQSRVVIPATFALMAVLFHMPYACYQGTMGGGSGELDHAVEFVAFLYKYHIPFVCFFNIDSAAVFLATNLTILLLAVGSVIWWLRDGFPYPGGEMKSWCFCVTCGACKTVPVHCDQFETIAEVQSAIRGDEAVRALVGKRNVTIIVDMARRRVTIPDFA